MRLLWTPSTPHRRGRGSSPSLCSRGGFLLFRATWPLVAAAWNRATRGGGSAMTTPRAAARRRGEALRRDADHPRRLARRRRSGERHAIIGPNGAGKSTLFNLISGRFAPTRGSIRLDGTDIAGAPPYAINRRGLSRSFQVTNIFPRLSVFENLRCGVLWSLGYRYCFWRNADALARRARARRRARSSEIGLDGAARRAGRRPDLRRAARAGDRHHDRRRRARRSCSTSRPRA